MREWLPSSHPVWMVIEIVGTHLDTTAFHTGRKVGGVGRAGYDPDMLLTLLIWAWSRGQRSSRRIERACHDDVAYRVICAGDAPDHATISRFRKDNDTACEELFTQVLLLAASLGLGRLETIALDGVKIASNASLDANRTESGLRAAQEQQARRIAATAVAAHAATDDAEDTLYGDDDPGPGQVPAELTHPGTRAARIAEALADLQRQRAAEQAARDGKADSYLHKAEAGAAGGRPPTAARVAAAEARLNTVIAAQQLVHERFAARQTDEAGRARGGGRPVPIDEHYTVRRARTRLEKARAAEQGTTATTAAAVASTTAPKRNITDPQSRPQPLRGGGWVQGYNCQAFTSIDGIIVAVDVGTSSADCDYYQAMVRRVCLAALLIDAARRGEPLPAAMGDEEILAAATTLISLMLFDAGYLSRANLTAPGPDRLIATGTRRSVGKAAAQHPASGPATADDPIEAMAHRLRTEDGITAYRQRSHIAETTFAHAKHNLGFRRFTGRGLDRARSEWSFHAAVHNIGKILTHLAGNPLPATG